MDKHLYDFFKEINFDDSEIQSLVDSSPTLDEISVEEATQNLYTLVLFGYPADDLTYIISMNPNFLCRNTEEFKKDMEQIYKTYGDVEEAIKSNPNLI